MVFTFLRYRICGKNVPWRTAGNGYFVLCFRVFAVQELCQKRTMTCCGKRVFRTAFLRFCGTEFAQEAAGLALGQSFGLLASLGPSLPAHLIQCVCGPGNYVEWVYTPLGVGTVFLYAGGNPPGSIR